MQESNAPAEQISSPTPAEQATNAAASAWRPRLSRRAAAAAVLFTILAAGFITLRCLLPGADWRNARTATPWVAENATVATAEGLWISAATDERMALRLAYFPQLTLTLTDCTGEGILYVSFRSNTGSPVGGTLHLRYNKDGFLPQHNIGIDAEGNTAVCRIAKGFEFEGEFLAHHMKQGEQLWRAEVRCLPAGAAKPTELGFVSILTEAE